MAFYLVFFFTCLLAVLFLKPADLFLFINGHHQPILDTFFRYVTWLGSGYIYAAVFLFFLFRKEYSYVVAVIFILLLQTLITTSMKQWLFPDMLRPLKVLGQEAIHQIEGVKLHGYHSFPSGHTASAFAVATLLAIRFVKPFVQWTCLVVALLVAYSRVYLGQHFVHDVWAGSVIGIFSAGIVMYWFISKPPPFLKKWNQKNEKNT